MRKREPSCWRAFWITATLVGIVNASLAAYYWSLPIERIPKFGGEGRDAPTWLIGVTAAINLPGIILAIPVVISTGCESEMARIALAQILGTIFWGLVAVILEWCIPRTVARPLPRAPDQ